MHNRACEYYDIMQVLYGHKFLSQFNGQTNLERIFAIIEAALSTLSDEQFQKGMAYLNAKAGSGDFCPTLSDFKSWCVAGNWWTAAEAWQRACDYSNLRPERIAALSSMKPVDFLKQKDKITVLTKKAWDSVCHLVEQGNTKAAYKQFQTIYDTYLAKAQSQGRQQEWYVPPVMIESKSMAIAESKPQQLNDEQQRIAVLTSKKIGQGLSLKQAFEEAQIEVRGYIKAMTKCVGKGGVV